MLTQYLCLNFYSVIQGGRQGFPLLAPVYRRGKVFTLIQLMWLARVNHLPEYGHKVSKGVMEMGEGPRAESKLLYLYKHTQADIYIQTHRDNSQGSLTI